MLHAPARPRRREALELPPPTRPRSIEPPRDDLERAVASIFEHMLAVSPVGRGDDFFLLGGDSLALAELQTRLRDTCGATLPGLVDRHRRRHRGGYPAIARDSPCDARAPVPAATAESGMRRRCSWFTDGTARRWSAPSS
jgi:hypothetical protein